MPKGGLKNNFNIEHKDIDYKDYRKKVYKILQKRYTKQNVGLRNISIPVKHNLYNLNIVPAYSYRSYQNVVDKDGNVTTSFVEGVAFCPEGGKRIINYPHHDNKNYYIANNKTDYRFNAAVRLMENLSYWITRKEGYSTMMHPYLIFCLVYNVPNTIFKRMIGYDELIEEIVDYLYGVVGTDVFRDMYEINEIKLLFSSKQTFSVINT